MNYYKPDTLTSSNKNVIENAIQFRMELLGFKPKEERPDLLVIYRLFREDFDFRGYSQPDFKRWVVREDTTESYDPLKYNLKNGTLLIHLIDQRKGQTVWLGYASGIYSSSQTRLERTLKSAVIAIFDKFEIFASGSKYPNSFR